MSNTVVKTTEILEAVSELEGLTPSTRRMILGKLNIATEHVLKFNLSIKLDVTKNHVTEEDLKKILSEAGYDVVSTSFSASYPYNPKNESGTPDVTVYLGGLIGGGYWNHPAKKVFHILRPNNPAHTGCGKAVTKPQNLYTTNIGECKIQDEKYSLQIRSTFNLDEIRTPCNTCFYSKFYPDFIKPFQ